MQSPDNHQILNGMIPSKNLNNAFSLLELLIAMAIVATLACIAYPSYQHYLLKAHRNQAEMDLMNTAEQLENYYSLNGSYQNATFTQLHVKDHSTYYLYQLKSLTEENYSLIANPIGNQFQDPCSTLWIRSDGSHGGNQENCWDDFK